MVVVILVDFIHFQSNYIICKVILLSSHFQFLFFFFLSHLFALASSPSTIISIYDRHLFFNF